MSTVKRFSGPIEEIVGRTCPGATYCGIDQCFRNGKTCGNDSSCCLTRPQAQDLVTALGCGGGGNFTIEQPTPKFSKVGTSPQDRSFSTLSEDPMAMDKCTTQLSLTPSDKEYLCQNLSPDVCFSKMCDLGCSSPMCPKPTPTVINLQNSVCQTVQQYCDVLDPSLLSDPNYNKLCCEIDPIAGVKIRTVCGCPGNPCVTNPLVTQLKTNAAQYWKDNPPQSTEILPVVPVVVEPPIVQPSLSEESDVNIKKYILFILCLILVIGGGLYWYSTRKMF